MVAIKCRPTYSLYSQSCIRSSHFVQLIGLAIHFQYAHPLGGGVGASLLGLDEKWDNSLFYCWHIGLLTHHDLTLKCFSSLTKMYQNKTFQDHWTKWRKYENIPNNLSFRNQFSCNWRTAALNLKCLPFTTVHCTFCLFNCLFIWTPCKYFLAVLTTKQKIFERWIP